MDIQTDLEEAKGQEIAKLRSSLQEMQSKVDETTATIVKEREAAKKAIEEAPPVVKETTVIVEDTEKIDSLTAEAENLKVHIIFSPNFLEVYSSRRNVLLLDGTEVCRKCFLLVVSTLHQ